MIGYVESGYVESGYVLELGLIFDPINQRILLNDANVGADELYASWLVWTAQDDNAQYGTVIREVVGENPSGAAATYYYLQGNWRVRPLEEDHTLVLSGYLLVEGGGFPVVATLEPQVIDVQYTIPLEKQSLFSVGTYLSVEAIAAAVLASLEQATVPVDVRKMNGATLIGDGTENNKWRGDSV